MTIFVAQLIVPSDGLGAPAFVIPDWTRGRIFLMNAGSVRRYRAQLKTQSPVESHALDLPATNRYPPGYDPVSGCIIQQVELTGSRSGPFVKISVPGGAIIDTWGISHDEFPAYPDAIGISEGTVCVQCGDVGYAFVKETGTFVGVLRTDKLGAAGFHAAVVNDGGGNHGLICAGASGYTKGSVFLTFSAGFTASIPIYTIEVVPEAKYYDIGGWPSANPFISNRTMTTLNAADVDAAWANLHCDTMGYDQNSNTLRLVLESTTNATRYMIAIDADDGTIIWRTVLPTGGYPLRLDLSVGVASVGALYSGHSNTIDAGSGLSAIQTATGVAPSSVISSDLAGLALVQGSYQRQSGSPLPVAGTPDTISNGYFLASIFPDPPPVVPDVLPVWSIPPDWSNHILERLEWLTDVLQSPSGAEQRRKMRLTPRRTFEMGFTVEGPERTMFDLQVKAAGAADWYVPVWHDIQRINADVAGGVSTALGLKTTNHEYAAGSLAILYGGLFSYEIVVVSAVTADFLILAFPVVDSWPAGTRLMPVVRARFSAEPPANRQSDQVWSGTVSFRCTRADPLPWTPAALTPTYAGFPVLTSPPDESSALAVTYQRLTTDLDNQTGRTLTVDTAGFGFAGRQHRWFLAGLTEHAALRSFLYAVAGRCAAFWMPTFAADLSLVGPVAAADNTITIRRCGYTEYGSNLPGRQDLAFQFRDGSFEFREITASAISDDTEVLVISPNMGRDVSFSSLERISFMALSRQDSDQVEISHETDVFGVGTVATTIRDAPDLRSTGA
jgi:hypothetical protein